MSRLDIEMSKRQLVASRSQAESFIKLGKVKVNGRTETKAARQVSKDDEIALAQEERYVSRAGMKLASVAVKLNLNFNNKAVLDVGSSTGGFTDYALKHDARKVVAVDVGTDQLHPLLRTDGRIELHEKTDIRGMVQLSETPDIVVIDVSFISLREVLPAVAKLSNSDTQIIAMVKPQFEAGAKNVHKGIIKNDKIRRRILRDFEDWVRKSFVIEGKADSEISGAKGNLERFYSLRKIG